MQENSPKEKNWNDDMVGETKTSNQRNELKLQSKCHLVTPDEGE
jgi:hypothetical protein